MTRGKAAGWLQARPAETHDALPHAGGCFRAGHTPRHLGISEPSKPLEMCFFFLFFPPRRRILLFLGHWGSADDAGCSLVERNPQDEHHHAAINYTEGLTPTGSLTQRSLTSLLIPRPHQAGTDLKSETRAERLLGVRCKNKERICSSPVPQRGASHDSWRDHISFSPPRFC